MLTSYLFCSFFLLSSLFSVSLFCLYLFMSFCLPHSLTHASGNHQTFLRRGMPEWKLPLVSMFSAFLQSTAHVWSEDQYGRIAELVMEDAYQSNSAVQAVCEKTLVFLLAKPPTGVKDLVRFCWLSLRVFEERVTFIVSFLFAVFAASLSKM